MAVFVFADNVSTTLAAAITTTSQTTVTLSSATNLPTIPSGDVWALTLNDAATQAVYEIVYVTARTGATLTVVRGQENTTALTWLVNDFAYGAITAGGLSNFAQSATAGAIAIDTSSTAQTKAGQLTVSQINGSGAGLTSGSVPNAALATTPVTGVSATGNVTSSGGTTPSIGFSPNPGFTTVTASGLITGGSASIGGVSLSGTNVSASTGSFGGQVIFGGASSLSGGGSAPSVLNAGANLLALQGQNSSTGVELVNLTTAVTIAEFISVSTTEAFVDAGGTYHTISDRREKENIVPVERGAALAQIMRLKAVDYTRKGTGNPERFFIAQDVRRVIPVAVSKKHNRYFVSDREIISTMAAAMQEQQTMIAALIKQNAKLEKRLAKAGI